MCVSFLSRVWLLTTPWTVAHQAPLSMGILQVRVLESAAMLTWGSCPPSNWTQVSCISGGLFTVWATREATPNPSSRQPQIHFLLLSIYLFWIFHIDGIVQYVVLCTSLLSLNLIFKIYPQCNIYQYFNYGWVLLHCMDMPHFVYPMISWWDLGCLHILTIKHSATMNIHVSHYISIYVLISLRCIGKWNCWVIFFPAS